MLASYNSGGINYPSDATDTTSGNMHISSHCLYHQASLVRWVPFANPRADNPDRPNLLHGHNPFVLGAFDQDTEVSGRCICLLHNYLCWPE